MKTITTTQSTPNSKDTAPQKRPESRDARSAPGTKATVESGRRTGSNREDLTRNDKNIPVVLPEMPKIVARVDGVRQGRTYTRDELKSAAGIGNSTLDGLIHAGLRPLSATPERGQVFFGDDYISILVQKAEADGKVNQFDRDAFSEYHAGEAGRRIARKKAAAARHAKNN